jgi:hypothetical protein
MRERTKDKCLKFLNKKIERLLVQEFCVNTGKFSCVCDCGKKTHVRYDHILDNSTKSCGCLSREKAINKGPNLKGRIFRHLTVVEKATKNKYGQRPWLCKCKCGKIVSVFANALLTNRQSSCGCKSNKPVGTKYKHSSGYVSVKVAKDFEGKGKTNKNWMFEHVYVMEQKLGRKLHNHENVHHKNGIKDDNRESNLELWTKRQPTGKRVEDMFQFCLTFIETYKDEINLDGTQ